MFDFTKRSVVGSREFFLPPELYDQATSVLADEADSQVDAFKVDIYCLGLTMLKAGALDDMRRLYGKKAFDKDVLAEMLTDFGEFYSESDRGSLIVNVVMQMLKQSQRHRPTAQQITSILHSSNPKRRVDDQRDHAQTPEPMIFSNNSLY